MNTKVINTNAGKAPAHDAAPLASDNVLDVRNLSVNFVGSERTVQAVQDLSFTVGRGETLAIVGESGSGKSVTSLSLMRLVEHGGGRIVNGQMLFRRRQGQVVDLAQLPGAQLRAIRGADMAMIFQEPMTSLNPVFTVGDQIAESIRLHQGLGQQQASAEALRMLDQVRIPEARAVMSRFPHQLSGGMRQRVMIAMALACKPALLIADEPTTALDVTIQAQILQLIRELQKEMSMGVIFITHDMGVVAEVADRVLVMYKGNKVEHNGAEAIFHHPQHAYTKALLSAVPRLGSMNGTSLPAHFELLSLQQAKADQAVAAKEPVVLAPNREAGPILQVKDLVTRFDVTSGIFNRVVKRVHAVEKVSFDLYPAETLALVGESGCGKSTTGRSLLRLIQAHSGQILFQGRDISKLNTQDMQAVRRDIQFIFQDPYASLDPRQTVGYSIMEPLLIHRVASGREALARVEWLLEKVGLPPAMAQRYPHEFSGGQRQRICIARALALNPKVVIADESVSALDVSIQAQIVNLLMDLQKEFGISYLFISHDMAVVERISHRVAVMYLGQVVELGSRREIFENPQHPYTQKLMAAVPIADPERRHKLSTLMAGEIPSPVRAVGDEPLVMPLEQVGTDHFVARHAVGIY
ncbi:glutathione import ATP-binding protein GsiA [Advenella mimigardefordensis DPN7]|uniref:Glutathione import ATP-binding protein GsiA n=1 Tax=Advenella mimigardefordensis (strain DSM 17166 / LMG 22922 / DPN7) TaxID=1247726 RepID=W0PBA3_ADVMD|nr:glutathione import ATP-binding protein GsiA [Advenella mimigardefordensis DPN7]